MSTVAAAWSSFLTVTTVFQSIAGQKIAFSGLLRDELDYSGRVENLHQWVQEALEKSER